MSTASNDRRGWPGPLLWGAMTWAAIGCGQARTQAPTPAPRAPVPATAFPFDPDTMRRLLAEEDCDGDRRLTVLDRDPRHRRLEGCEGNGLFELTSSGNAVVQVRGTTHLSNLLGELELARRRGAHTILLGRVFENPVHRISRSIRERFWDGLTRRLDAGQLSTVLRDPKLHTDALILYVPGHDTEALDYYQAAIEPAASHGVAVQRLPEPVTPAWVRGLGPRHGMLALAGTRPVASAGSDGWRPAPYVVPGGRFNELYGWDSYFHVLGLLQDDRRELAEAIANHLIYEVEHYGKVLNANRTYYLTRSQPPFLSSIVRALWDDPRRRGSLDKAWLSRALRAVAREYRELWSGEARSTQLCTGTAAGTVCLSHYFDEGLGEPPEVEPGHFDWIYDKYARAHGVTPARFRELYRAGTLQEPALDRFFKHDRAMRESGHDTTYRWFDPVLGEDRAADYATVDLNALLYRVENDLAALLRAELEARSPAGEQAIAGLSSQELCARARGRRDLLRRYCWNEQSALFYDYDAATGKQSRYLGATTLYPLWASSKDCDAPLLSPQEATRLVAAALSALEAPGGIAATAKASVEPFAGARARQWDYPNGWAPHQMLAWQGLHQFGFRNERQRLIYRWLYTITRNAADFAGTIPEKLDVVARSHRVFAEYGNVGTEFSYITDEGFGWMNASYQVGLAALEAESRDALARLEPPEQRFVEK